MWIRPTWYTVFYTQNTADLSLEVSAPDGLKLAVGMRSRRSVSSPWPVKGEVTPGTGANAPRLRALGVPRTASDTAIQMRLRV